MLCFKFFYLNFNNWPNFIKISFYTNCLMNSISPKYNPNMPTNIILTIRMSAAVYNAIKASDIRMSIVQYSHTSSYKQTAKNICLHNISWREFKRKYNMHELALNLQISSLQEWNFNGTSCSSHRLPASYPNSKQNQQSTQYDGIEGN